MSGKADSIKSIFYALGANFAIAVAKLVGAGITGSSSMLAEAIHSFADCGNQGLLLLGLKRAKRPPSPDHPLGYGKAIYFWSFIVALILFSMGGLFSINEGLHKLQATQPLTSPWVAVGILVFGMIAEGLSLLGCTKEVNKVRGDRSLWRWFRESRQSELIVIMGEDIAALFGLAVALIAILLTMYTGNPLFDALGSIGIGVLLVIVAIGVGIEIKDLLIGQSAEPQVRQAIHEHISALKEVDQVFNLITYQLGDRIMVAVKAKMTTVATPDELIDATNRCETSIREAFPAIQWLFFEPDLRD
jgi:cation diffusion facilitator family transporter